MLECVSNNESTFGEKTIGNLKDHRSVTDGDHNNGLDPPSTPSAVGHEKDSSYVSSSSEDDSSVHNNEEECEASIKMNDEQKDDEPHQPSTPIITNAAATTATPSKLNDTVQEICNMSISSSLPALQENDADVDVTPSEDLEVTHTLSNDEELRERISHLESQLDSLNCTLKDLMISIDPNRLKKVCVYVRELL